MSTTPSNTQRLRASRHLTDVKYEIRGPLQKRALELEAKGYDVIKLNIGNPAAFGFRMPEAMRVAVIESLPQADGYTHQKGIFTAREAVAMAAQARGVKGVTADDVFLGNGVSELILMCLEALLEPGDEVLVPAPDYPLWTAAIVLTGARAVHYPCPPEQGFVPDPAQVAAMVTSRTKAIVLINPNNPTGAVYPRDVVEGLARVAEEHDLVLFADEIYDRITYDGAQHVHAADFCHHTLCVTLNGLSKVYRACGLRAGWAIFSGAKARATEYVAAVELLASLRLCSNAPGQYAVQTALGGVQSIDELTAKTGRLGRQRAAVLAGVAKSKHLEVATPMGALYAFVKLRETERFAGLTDAAFALRLLEEKHVFVVPGSSFHFPRADHFRVTFLPDEETLADVFGRIESLLDEWPLR